MYKVVENQPTTTKKHVPKRKELYSWKEADFNGAV